MQKIICKYFLGCRAFSTSVAAYSVNTITLPVGVSRRAVITHTATKTTGLVSIYVTAYRRIGTNL